MSFARIESLEHRLFLAAQAVVLGGDGQGHPVSILDGDFTPSRADSTDFGYSMVNQYEITRTFRIQNTGDAPLTLDSPGTVQLLGDSSFIVQSQPTTTTIAAKNGDTISSTTFTIRFFPTLTGAKSAEVRIMGADDAPLFSFMIAGTGLSPNPVYETAQGGGTVAMQYAPLVTGSGSSVTTGSLVNISYAGYLLNGAPETAFNFGSAGLSAPLAYTIGGPTVLKGLSAGTSGMLVGEKRVLFIPKSLAYSESTPTVPAGVPTSTTDSAYIFEVELVRVGAVGSASVYGGNGLASKVLISKNDTTPTMGDSTDFGYTNIGTNGYTISRTFSIENTGGAPLTLKSTDTVVLEGIDGYDSSAFSVKSQPSSIVLQQSGSSGNATTFTINFKPTTAGFKKATVKVLGENGDSIYSFVISGTGLVGTPLTYTPTTGTPSTMEYATTISGSGTAATDGSAVSVYYSGYLLDGTPTTKFNFDSRSVGSTPFDVKIGAGAVIKGWDTGLKGMQVGETRYLFIPADMAYGASGSGSIPANSPLIFKVDMVRFGSAGGFTVTGNGQTISNGDITPAATDFTDFGIASVNVPITRKFNFGGTSGALSGVDVVIDAADGPFTVVSKSGTDVVLQFLPTAVGEATAKISITPQAVGATPYTFTVKGSTYNADKTGVAFSYDAIYIKGTAENDTLKVAAVTSSSGTKYKITYNGTTWDEDIAPVTGVSISRITMEGGDGDDVLEATNSVTLGVSLSGGAGNDTLTGSAGSDTLDGGAGDDSLRGLGGSDSLIGGAGNDSMEGSAGNDTFSGGLGADTMKGGDGTDLVTYAGEGRTAGVTVLLDRDWGNGSDADAASEGGSAGDAIYDIENLTGTEFDDRLVGTRLANSIVGGDGNDSISAGAGNDTLVGDAGNDTLRGDAGNDSLNAGEGNDDAKGGAGDDIILGGAGNDTLCGDAGKDSLKGEAGDDALYGNAGNDVLWGGFGADEFYGGTGKDSASYADESRTKGVSVTQNDGRDDGSTEDASGDLMDYIASDIEIIGTTTFDDTIVASGKGDRIVWAYTGNDHITGSQTGRNELWGGGGNDTIIGGKRSDRLYGDDSSSTTSTSAGANDGNDSIHGGAGNDTIVGGGGADTLKGGANNDWIYSKDGTHTDVVDGLKGYNRAWVDDVDTTKDIDKLLD